MRRCQAVFDEATSSLCTIIFPEDQSPAWLDLTEAQAPAAHLSPVCVTSRVRITERPIRWGTNSYVSSGWLAKIRCQTDGVSFSWQSVLSFFVRGPWDGSLPPATYV